MKVLVVGSSVIDLFLKIEDEHHMNVEGHKVSFNLGDKIPIEITQLAIGGNGANVSVGLSRLGISTIFYTYLTNDLFSREIEEGIKKEGVRVLAEGGEGEKSSLSLVFDINQDRIIFSHHQIKEHIFSYDDAPPPDFVYVTSIGKHWENAYSSILTFLSQHHIDYAFAPGTHQLKDKGSVFLEMLAGAKIIFINKEEAQDILEYTGSPSESDIKSILLALKALGSTIVSVTDGAHGAYILDGHQQVLFIPSIQAPILEKTGAGDAYASGFLSSYVQGNSIGTCMQWGTVNAHHSMQKVGAQTGLLRKEEMTDVLNSYKELRVENLAT